MNLIWRVSGVLDEQIRHLPPDLKRRVRDAQEEIRKNPSAGKMLTEDLEGYRSYRIGRYRLIYRVEPTRLVLVAIGSRRDIYKRVILELARGKIRERAAKCGAKPRRARVHAGLRPKKSARHGLGFRFPLAFPAPLHRMRTRV